LAAHMEVTHGTLVSGTPVEKQCPSVFGY